MINYTMFVTTDAMSRAAKRCAETGEDFETVFAELMAANFRHLAESQNAHAVETVGDAALPDRT